MKEMHKFYINGEWVNSLGSETIEVINPSDESIIGSIAAGTKEDIDVAVGAAKDALNVLIPTIFHSFHMIKGEKH